MEGKLVTGQNKSDKGLRDVLEMKNTPGESGLSPAQMMFGSEMRSILPTNRRFLRPIVEEESPHDNDVGRRIQSKRVSFWDDVMKTKDTRLDTERLQDEVHLRMEEQQRRSDRRKSKVYYKKLAGR